MGHPLQLSHLGDILCDPDIPKLPLWRMIRRFSPITMINGSLEILKFELIQGLTEMKETSVISVTMIALLTACGSATDTDKALSH